MKKKEYMKTCDLFVDCLKDKKTKEYFNEYGYNYSFSRVDEGIHYKSFCTTNQNNIKIKPKR